MAEIKLTAAQQAVVENRGGTLLVSAAAGSGKTKVLVDRLLSMVLSKDAPHNIDEYLLITYTKAAAAELRGKIQAALQERLAREPENRRIQRQLTRIYLAEISTVHAFCSGILRENAYLLDIPADFRVGEELETAALREQAAEQVIAEAYEAGDPEFLAFADTLGGGRDDRTLSQILLSLYEKARSHRDPAAFLKMSAEALSPQGDFGVTIWGGVLMEALFLCLDDAIGQMTWAAAQIENDSQLEAAYGETFRSNCAQLRQLRACSTWDEVVQAGVPEFGRLKPLRKCDHPEEKECLQAVRKDCAERVKAQMRCFCLNSEAAAQETAAIAPAIRGALGLAERFGAQYGREKRRRHLLDFGDLEHEALRLLYGGGRVPTAAAREIAARYDAIFVDEYQDSNAVQDAIFRAVSREEQNLFFVGDVKQSIYRFRLADPGIFLQKYKAFAPYQTAEAGEPRKIVLSSNFRSRREILEAVNDVFSFCMSERTGDLQYGEEEALQAGMPFPEREGSTVELHCIKEDQEGDEWKKDEVEAAFVANRVSRLLREGTLVTEKGALRPVRPEDIAILLRSPRSAAPSYLSALQRAGVPCFCDTGEDILQRTELQVVSSLLEVVENPHQDIPLLAVLASPLWGFSADDLAEIRSAGTTDYYDALCASALPKAQAFLRQLSLLRTLGERDGLAALMDAALRETKAMAVFGAMAQGPVRTANLRYFRKLVLDHAQNGGDLYSFVRTLQDLRATGLTVTETAGRGALLLTSIHKSKGLEYPVVILSGLSRAFNLEDLRKPVLVHPELGVASNVTDLRLRLRYPSTAKQALARKLRDEAISEELRVLYVAMTRAKDLLIMTYCTDYFETRLCKLRRLLDSAAKEQAAAAAVCQGDWILLTALQRTEAGELFAVCGAPQSVRVSDTPWKISLHSGSALMGEPIPGWQGPAEQRALTLPEAETLKRELAYVYPHLAASRLPSKMTATQLKGRRLDDEISADTSLPLPRRRRPGFLEAGLSPTEAGTALHLAMQFLRYEACGSEAALQAELQRLVREEFLTEAQAAAVNPNQILRFFASPLGQRILSAKTVRREFKFSVLLDAGGDAAGEQILLQGVTDCCLVEEDGVTVLDFKTDRVAPGGEAARAEHYRGQLEGYAAALSRIFQRPVREKILYFFATDTAISL